MLTLSALVTPPSDFSVLKNFLQKLIPENRTRN